MTVGGRGANINQPHGTVYYSANDAVLNAAPFSLTSQRAINPAYLQQRFGAAIGGPLVIPHIYNGASKTFFFMHYNGTLGDTPYSFFSTVPTLLERSGNFSQTMVNGEPVQIFNPATGLPFANATIPQSMINSASQGEKPHPVFRAWVQWQDESSWKLPLLNIELRNCQQAISFWDCGSSRSAPGDIEYFAVFIDLLASTS
jgi:hypothetical protein